ncbi:MAG: hypothetical protein H7A51_13940 [Akkermansiaceae bacterium]|nr:hypothetical protein [Akkermansiaceae bacterium]
MKNTLLITFIGVAACSEEPKNTPETSQDALRIEDVRKVMAKSEGWTTTFVSRGGEYAGMDSDSSITFFDDGKVSMVECGVAPVTYNGTYTIDADGVITLKLKTYPGSWPQMIIRDDSGKILLHRLDGAIGLEFGGRGGAVETPEMKPFWPFGLSSVLWPEPNEEDDVDNLTPDSLLPE